MTEWGVVSVIIALGGFIFAIIKLIAPLIKSITSLDCSIKNLSGKIDEITLNEKEQNQKLEDHEIRIVKLESK